VSPPPTHTLSLSLKRSLPQAARSHQLQR
jgi:hypothetical protein